jgi:hypothetical protein
MMAKKNDLQPGQALPGQLEGPDTHFSTDKTTNAAHVESHPKGGYPKFLYYKDPEGNVVSRVVENAEEHAEFSDHAESPAEFESATESAEEQTQEDK